MHTTNLRNVGGSILLAVPPAILDLLHLRAGATVNLSVEEERLIMWRQAKPRYTLDELLAQCDPTAPISDEDRSWVDVAPVACES
jgi:antitoxin ChpS